MFPIGDEKGNIIAFGGRIIDKDSSPQKYLNSPDTPLFHKSRNLYGLHLARTGIRNADQAIIVEGYMDVISCHQHGITNAIAPLGTAFTPEQGKLLMRSTYQMGISFDGDAAGVKATMRCLDILSDLGCTARVIQIPDQADPDEYLKVHGKEAFEKLIADAQELIMYKIGRYMETTNTETITGKMKVVSMLLPDLRKMQSAVARESAIRQISIRLAVSEKAIWDELRKNTETSETVINDENHLSGQEILSSAGKNNENIAGKIESKVEKNILHILFDRPDFLEQVEQYGGAELFSEAAAGIYEEFKQSIQRCGKVDSAGIAQEKGQLLADLLMDELYITDQEKSITNALWQLKSERLDQEYQRLSQRLTENRKVGDTVDMQELQETLQKLDDIRREKKELEASRKGE
jgi:DNA primase